MSCLSYWGIGDYSIKVRVGRNLAGRRGQEKAFQAGGRAYTKAGGRRPMSGLGTACGLFFLLG